MFHLFTHAFFKALLFLASGRVMHAMGGVIDMRRFGGLRHRMPYTYWTFLVGALALCGHLRRWRASSARTKSSSLSEPPRTKARRYVGGVYTLIYWVAVFTAFMTAFYTGRAFF